MQATPDDNSTLYLPLPCLPALQYGATAIALIIYAAPLYFSSAVRYRDVSQGEKTQVREGCRQRFELPGCLFTCIVVCCVLAIFPGLVPAAYLLSLLTHSPSSFLFLLRTTYLR
jgi:hypothetical protein